MFSKVIPVLIVSIIWIASGLVIGSAIANLEGDAGFITASIQGEGDTGF
ncbi:MAG: hypothetical protein F6K30_25550 [Cyanothece sp. SIO2G6]|nr:hypothetical protein [Cyanothece sp. SIO2G6]